MMAETEDPGASEADRARAVSRRALDGLGGGSLSAATGDLAESGASSTPKLLDGYFEGTDPADMSPDERLVYDAARAAQDRVFNPDGDDKAVPDEPEPDKPADPRLLGLVTKDVAKDMARDQKPVIDRIVELEEGGEFDLADDLRAHADKIGDQFLKDKETAGGRTEDVGEARERADRESRLQVAVGAAERLAAAASLEAAKLAEKDSLDAGEQTRLDRLEAEKQSRIEQAEALLKQANEVGDQAGKRYQSEQAAIKAAAEERRIKVRDAAAKGVVDVDEMMELGRGGWKVDFSNVDPQDLLEAAKGVEDLLGKKDTPELELKADRGRVRELIYQTDKRGSSGGREPLVIVERWDNVTGKLISLNTIVADSAVRVARTAKFWKGRQLFASREVENQMRALRLEDEPWKLKDGNSTRNSDSDAITTAMSYMGTPESADWQGKPTKKRNRRRWWEFS